MIPVPLIPFLLPTVGYAETHYRFRFLPSLLKKNEPEVLFDAPHRLDPGERLPIVLLAKDAHMYPADVLEALVEVRVRETLIRSERLVHERIRLTEEWWWTIFNVDVGDTVGWMDITVRFSLSTGGRTKTYTSNNYRSASHAPLRVYRSETSLPLFPGSVTGEAHAHSNYTSDQVEYGLPLRASRYLSKPLGLGFLCITDHSYDLDDQPDSYLRNDPSLRKWNGFQVEVDELNGESKGPVIIRGEEVTVRNGLGKNVHCLVYGDRTFHPGSGDSAERWLETNSELSLSELVIRVSNTAGVFGAHIAENVPLLQQWLLGRGSWAASDFEDARVDGVQFWNGTLDDGMMRGKHMWVEALLRGRRCVSIAGNDAHGNFNRFLQLRIPFLQLHDADRQLFGRVRTSVFSNEVNEASIIEALREGRSSLSDGPAVCIVTDEGTVLLGRTLPPGQRIVVRALSTPEFGPIASVRLYRGKAGNDTEECIEAWNPGSMEFTSQELEPLPDTLYIRAEVETQEGDAYRRPHFSLTNPVWGAKHQ